MTEGAKATDPMKDTTSKIHIDEIIVVEGRDDTSAVLTAVDGITIETHGYGIRKETWEMLEKAYETRGLIIFTDPDPAGERIRRTLTERFPKAKQAFLDQEDAMSGDDIGIENASPEDIRRALETARGPGEGGTDETLHSIDRVFTMKDMDRWGLAGSPKASHLRRALGRELGLGFASAKTFLKRLNHFGVSCEEVEEALRTILQDSPYQ